MFFKREDKLEYIKSKSLSESLKITSQKLQKILELLKWIEKSDTKGWLATELGLQQGAKQAKYMGADYVMWDSRIITNLALITAVNKSKNNVKIKKIVKKETKVEVRTKRMSNLQKKEKGDSYELFIGLHYREQGYTTSQHGIDNGVKDCGIDIIAKKGMQILFIQCKNWDSTKKKKIESHDIKSTRQDAQDYMDDNPLYEMYESMIVYIMAENVLHASAYHYMEKYKDKVQYKIIPMS